MNKAIVSTVSRARTQGRPGAPLRPVCSIRLASHLVLDRNLLLPLALSRSEERGKGLTGRSQSHEGQTHLDEGLPRLQSQTGLWGGECRAFTPLLKQLPLGARL